MFVNSAFCKEQVLHACLEKHQTFCFSVIWQEQVAFGTQQLEIIKFGSSGAKFLSTDAALPILRVLELRLLLIL